LHWNWYLTEFAENALGVLQDGAIITVDAARGLIYQGEINAK